MGLFDDALGQPVDTRGMPGSGVSTPMPLPPSFASAPAAGGAPRWAKILQLAIPAIASIYAAKKGGLGSFGESYAGQVNQGLERQDKQKQLREQKAERLAVQARQARQDAATAAAAQQRLERQVSQDKVAQDARDRSAVKEALDRALQDPLNVVLMRKNPEGYHVVVPGLGNISITDAFAKLGGVLDAAGNPVMGKGPEDPLVPWRNDTGAATTEELIPRSEAVKRGKHVVARPTPKESPAEKYTDVEEPDAEDSSIKRKYRVYFKSDGSVDRKVQTAGPPPEGGEALKDSISKTLTGHTFKSGRFTVTVEK